MLRKTFLAAASLLLASAASAQTTGQWGCMGYVPCAGGAWKGCSPATSAQAEWLAAHGFAGYGVKLSGGTFPSALQAEAWLETAIPVAWCDQLGGTAKMHN
jgi:hypothetical protein